MYVHPVLMILTLVLIALFIAYLALMKGDKLNEPWANIIPFAIGSLCIFILGFVLGRIV